MSTYQNPFWVHNFPDPFVLKVRGRYYAYATEETSNPTTGTPVFPILTSVDLVHWQFVGRAMPALGEPYHRYWAPEVTFQNGLFFLYYAVHRESEFTGGIRVAVAERPEGPFVDSGHDLTGGLLPWAIDPHVFRNHDGQSYLYMTIDYWNDFMGFVGSGNAVARMVDPFTLEEPVTRVTAPSHHWQLFEKQRQAKGGVDWYTVEGPAILKHRGRYYEMFSGGCYYRDNYAMSYAVSTTPMGSAGMQDASWQDWAGPLGDDREAVLVRGDGKALLSPGHNSLVLGPNNVDLYIAYHAQQPGSIERFPCLDRLFWHGDELWTAAPEHSPQSAPSLPRLRELFNHSALASCWESSGGAWRIVDEAVIQQEASAEYAHLLAKVPLEAAWLLEINVRYEAGTGNYGLVLQERDAQEGLQIAFTSDACLTISPERFSEQPLLRVPLPVQMRTQEWHQCLVTLNGSVLRIQIDWLPVGEILLPQGMGPFAQFALYTERCSAVFSGISLSDHFHDEFLDAGHTPALLGWRSGGAAILETDWRIGHGVLSQVSESGESLLLKNLALTDFECSATMRVRQTPDREGAAFGLVLWVNDHRSWSIHYTWQQGRWNLGLYEKQASADHALIRVPLAESFDPGYWQTLRVCCENNELIVCANGPEFFRLSFTKQRLYIGLRTFHTSIEVMDVWQTGLVH